MYMLYAENEDIKLLTSNKKKSENPGLAIGNITSSP